VFSPVQSWPFPVERLLFQHAVGHLGFVWMPALALTCSCSHLLLLSLALALTCSCSHLLLLSLALARTCSGFVWMLALALTCTHPHTRSHTHTLVHTQSHRGRERERVASMPTLTCVCTRAYAHCHRRRSTLSQTHACTHVPTLSARTQVHSGICTHITHACNTSAHTHVCV